jgi:hypothetical protein
MKILAGTPEQVMIRLVDDSLNGTKSLFVKTTGRQAQLVADEGGFVLALGLARQDHSHTHIAWISPDDPETRKQAESGEAGCGKGPLVSNIGLGGNQVLRSGCVFFGLGFGFYLERETLTAIASKYKLATSAPPNVLGWLESRSRQSPPN